MSEPLDPQEVLRRHTLCDNGLYPQLGTHCDAHEGVVTWPCDAVQLARQLQTAQERIAALEGALRRIADYEPDYEDVPELTDHTNCAECARWVGHPVQRGMCDAAYREIDRRNAARKSIDSAQHYHMRDIARVALAKPLDVTP